MPSAQPHDFYHPPCGSVFPPTQPKLGPHPYSRARMLSSISRLLPGNLNLNPLESDLFRSSQPASSRAVIDGPDSEHPHHGDQPRPSRSYHSDAPTHEKTKSDATDAAATADKRRRKDPASSEVRRVGHGTWKSV